MHISSLLCIFLFSLFTLQISSLAYSIQHFCFKFFLVNELKCLNHTLVSYFYFYFYYLKKLFLKKKNKRIRKNNKKNVSLSATKSITHTKAHFLWAKGEVELVWLPVLLCSPKDEYQNTPLDQHSHVLLWY